MGLYNFKDSLCKMDECLIPEALQVKCSFVSSMASGAYYPLRTDRCLFRMESIPSSELCFDVSSLQGSLGSSHFLQSLEFTVDLRLSLSKRRFLFSGGASSTRVL